MLSEDNYVVNLGDVSNISLSGVDKKITPGEKVVRLCNYLDVYRNRRLTSSIHFATGSASNLEIERFQLRRGDVLLTKDSETPDDIGVPAVVAEELPNTICGYHLALVRPRESLDSSFLGQYLLSDWAKRHFLQAAAGATRYGLNSRAIAALPLPSLDRQAQAAIAHVLDAVDSAIQRARHTLLKAEELDHSLLHELLAFGVSERRGIRIRPSHWETKRVSEAAEVGSGVTLGKDVTGFKHIELPYLRVANVQDGHLSLDTIKTVKVRVDEIEQYRLEPGDVLMTEGGDLDKLGRGAVWDGQIPNCLHQNHIFRVRCDRIRLLPRFFAYVVESDIAKRYFLRVAKRTTNLASTNKTQVRAFRFPVPPLDEQESIVATMNGSKAMIQALRDKEEALKALKKSLLHDLLTGTKRIDPPSSPPC